jgi:DNA-directed RNA polymerase subunit RPC12/RpoP
MAVKYQCPKCERRFVDWGAEKLGFKCPNCDDSDLFRMGSDDAPKLAPSLKRKSKPVVAADPEEALVGIEDKEDDATEGVIVEDDLEDLDTGDGDVVIDDDPLVD